MKLKYKLFLIAGIILILLIGGLYVYASIKNNEVKKECFNAGKLELQKAIFISELKNKGYVWTAKDELQYALNLAKYKNNCETLEKK